jgi:DNA polymerase I
LKVVIDIEANSLSRPSKVWIIVCKDIETGQLHIFREVTTNEEEKRRFQDFAKDVQLYIGHNILGYDLPVLVLHNLIDRIETEVNRCVDTLIISKLINYSRPQGHSLASYGVDYGLEKLPFSDWTKYSQQMEDYCVRDVDISQRVYSSFLNTISNPVWHFPFNTEQRFQLCVNHLHDHGFAFNVERAKDLLNQVQSELDKLDFELLEAFPVRTKLIREVHPEVTKHGTLHRKDFRGEVDLSHYNGGPFSRLAWVPFNPSSHKQIIDVLHAAGWHPIDKTTTHIETLREINQLKYRQKDPAIDLRLQECYTNKIRLEKYGWKVNETNLSTLPPDAPAPARTLAKRILYESRRRTLTEWLGLVQEDGRIHGKFVGIGAWTHRMAHQQPNMANIPNSHRTDGSVTLLGKELRSLFQAPDNRLLVGVDAEGIQLRIFAHYIDDKEFTNALVKGSKAERTDPHSLNQRILGDECRSRAAAKRFIYALLLGAGLDKLAEILGCSRQAAEVCLSRLMRRYQGFEYLKQSIIPRDAQRGYFIGLDGRRVGIPGDTVGQRKHLCMSGYLQNGEAIIMKMATNRFIDSLSELDSFLVNLVHDEWQSESPHNMRVAAQVAKIMCESLEETGALLNLKCPLAGSYWNEDAKDYTIGANWSVTH